MSCQEREEIGSAEEMIHADPQLQASKCTLRSAPPPTPSPPPGSRTSATHKPSTWSDSCISFLARLYRATRPFTVGSDALIQDAVAPSRPSHARQNETVEVIIEARRGRKCLSGWKIAQVSNAWLAEGSGEGSGSASG